jgi:hypothetical protein
VLRRAHERWNRFTKSAERGIIQEAFDSTARATIAALKRALPDRSDAEIVRAFQMMIGTMLYITADTGRSAHLIDRVSFSSPSKNHETRQNPDS